MKWLALLLTVGFLFYAMPSNTYGEMSKSKLGWRFDLFTGYNEFYVGRLIVFAGPIGLGTAYKYGFAEDGVEFDRCSSNFSVDNANYSTLVYKMTPQSYFPVIIHYVPYSRSLWYGTMNLYAYFDGSLWSKHEVRNADNIFYEVNTEFGYMGAVDFNPSRWFNIGLGISLSPLRFLPFDLRIGYLRMYYPYNRIPEPYREYVRRTPLSRFYLSLIFSLGYHSAQ